MKILIDARMTCGAMHGIARYTMNLVQALPTAAPQHEYFILVPPGNSNDRWYTGLEVTPVALPAAFVSLSEQLWLPYAIQRIAPDLFHSPSFMLPLVMPAPTVVTIHDLIHLTPGFSMVHRLYYRLIL